MRSPLWTSTHKGQQPQWFWGPRWRTHEPSHQAEMSQLQLPSLFLRIQSPGRGSSWLGHRPTAWPKEGSKDILSSILNNVAQKAGEVIFQRKPDSASKTGGTDAVWPVNVHSTERAGRGEAAEGSWHSNTQGGGGEGKWRGKEKGWLRNWKRQNRISFENGQNTRVKCRQGIKGDKERWNSPGAAIFGSYR